MQFCIPSIVPSGNKKIIQIAMQLNDLQAWWKLILGRIPDLKMGENQALIVGVHFHPRDQWMIV